jgi:hypothetical protein
MSNTVMLKAFCDWQIWGDVDPKEHLTEILRPWMGRGADGADGDLDEYLHDLEITYADTKGPFGLSYVQFWVVTPLQKDDLNEAKMHIRHRLNRFVGDSDVSVRWVISWPV